MREELLKETEYLYSDIDLCIDMLVSARLKKDEGDEKMALINMESIMVRTLQHLQCILESESNK
jgi:hypothetical protein